MKLIAYRRNLDCDVEFQDEYKYVFKNATYNNFKNGKVKNPYDKTIFGVGMLGDGKYMARYHGEKQMATNYTCWCDIIKRCYSDKERFPAYYELATVCDEWLIFQNFAKWYENNWHLTPNNERLHVDKDILIAGNKHYSPETCLMVPQRINMLFSNKSKIVKDGLPNGIKRTSSGKEFQALYNTIYLGRFKTLKKAYNAYAEEKERAIREIAEEYKVYIPEKLYCALLNYKVRIENDKNYQI